MTHRADAGLHLLGVIGGSHAHDGEAARVQAVVDASADQMRPGCRVVTSWTSQALPSGSLKAKNDP
jgi:hypothetical protein